MRRSVVMAAFLAATSLLAIAASTTLIKKDLKDLSREASVIVRARVASTTAAWNVSRTLIWTTNALEVLETWKGEAMDRVLVIEPGGEVGDVGQMVPGMARYVPGEEVIVFLTKDSLGQWRTLGCCQGRFRVTPAAPGSDGWTVVTEQRHVTAGEFPGAAAPTLAAFQARVRDLATPKTEGR